EGSEVEDVRGYELMWQSTSSDDRGRGWREEEMETEMVRGGGFSLTAQGQSTGLVSFPGIDW
ncbi:hypothetical protein KI387_000039, partial [Taxus chinensis]